MNTTNAVNDYTIGSTLTTSFNTETFVNTGTNYIDFPNFNQTVLTYYPMYYGYWNTPNKIEQAFKLAQKLLEKKLVKEPKTVKDFIELVNVLTDIL